MEVHIEPIGEPFEGSLVGPHTAALDLADVLLRKAPGAELGLRQTARDAQLSDALTERRGGWPVGQAGAKFRRDA